MSTWNIMCYLFMLSYLSLSCGEGKKDLEGLVCWCLRLGLAETVGHRPDSFIMAIVKILNVSELPSVKCKTS